MVDFLVIGPVLNVTDKNIFHLIKCGDISFGWNRLEYFLIRPLMELQNTKGY